MSTSDLERRLVDDLREQALLPSRTTDRESVAPVADASALRVARDFFDAFASFDRERAASLLADDAEVHI